jgi:signal transduction histidine kinase/HAMP domain-containing protein
VPSGTWLNKLVSGRPTRQVLRRAWLILVIPVLAACAAALVTLSAVSQGVHTLTQTLQPAAVQNATALQALSVAASNVRQYRFAHAPSSVESYRDAVRQYQVAISAALHTAVGDPEVRGLVRRESTAGQHWIDTYANPAISGSAAAITSAATMHGDTLFARFQADQTNVRRYLTNQAGRAEQGASDAEWYGFLIVGLLTVLTIMVGTATGLAITRGFMPRLERLAGALERLTAGDRSVRVVEVGTAEVQAVARAVNQLATESERYATEQEHRVRLSALGARVGRNVREHLELGAVLDDSVEAVGTALGVDRVLVRLVEDGRLGVVAAEWRADGLVPISEIESVPAALMAKVLERIALSQSTFVASDVEGTLLSANPEVAGYIERLGAKAALVCPLVCEGSLLGSLIIVDGAVRPWPADEVELVETLTTDIARAVLHGQRFERLRMQTDELYEKQRALGIEVRHLERSKGEFVSTVSHELRTPLTSISACVELLVDGDAGRVSAEQLRLLETIERSTARLRTLTEDILTISRIEAGELSATAGDVDMREVLEATRGTVTPIAERVGVHLCVNLPDSTAVVRGVSAQLERAMTNLATNAVKFSRRGGSATMTLGCDATHVIVAVNDTGIGIPEEDIPKLFTRFHRASNAIDQAVQGTGLGLAIVHGIVLHHRGTVTVESRVDRGTTFTVRLPRRNLHHGR